MTMATHLAYLDVVEAIDVPGMGRQKKLLDAAPPSLSPSNPSPELTRTDQIKISQGS